MTTQGTQSPELDGLPNDMLVNEIAPLLPLYHYRGKYNYYTVSKKWYALFPKFKCITPEDVIASVKTRENALYILNDPELVKQFSLEEFMILIAFVPEIATEILTRFGKLIHNNELEKMMAKHLWLSQFVFDNPEVAHENNLKARGSAIINLAKADLSLAKALICEFPQIKDPIGLSTDGHPLVEKMIPILNAYGDLLQYRPIDLLLELGRSHLSLAQAIFSLPDDQKARLFGIVDVNGMLAEVHLPLAERIWEVFLKEGACRGVLWRVVTPHPSIVKQLFQNESVVNTLHENVLLKLGEKYLFFAHYLLANKDLSALHLIHLGKAHQEIAQLVLNTPALEAKVQESGIFDIAMAHSIRSRIVRLLEPDIHQLISLAPIIAANNDAIQKVGELDRQRLENYAHIYTTSLELAKELSPSKSIKPY